MTGKARPELRGDRRDPGHGARSLPGRAGETVAVHERGLEIAARYGFAVYDAMIWAAALSSAARPLYSADMQAGQTIEGTTLHNPFG